MVKNRPVYDFKVIVDDNNISSFGHGSATISIPYSLNFGEDPNAIIVYFVDKDDTLKTIRGTYNSTAKTVNFTITHFSRYAVGYNKINFTDDTNTLQSTIQVEKTYLS